MLCNGLSAFLSVLGLTIAGSPALAGSFQVNPVNLEIPTDRSSTSVTLRNSGAAPVSVSAEIYRWTQEDGKDVYTKTRELIASPPIFTIEPGQAQLVRIGLLGSGRGSAYRVIFNEIPRLRPGGTGVEVALRLNLPLYVFSGRTGEAVLRWRAWRDGSGAIVLDGQNSGNRPAKLLEVAAIDEHGRRHVLSSEAGVVLPASTRRWKISGASRHPVGSSVTLRIQGPAGEAHQQVVVEQR